MSKVELTVQESDPIELVVSLGPSVMDGDKGDVEVSSGGGSWTVEGLQGRAVSATAPSNGYALVWNASTSQWEPQAQSGGGGVSDGDKGDITVSASGATWTIDNDAVTFAKLQNVKDARIIGRESGAGTGDAKEIRLDSQFVWTTISGEPALTISVPSDGGKVDTTTQVNAGTGLTGGGDLSTSRTISVATNGITTSLIADANVTFAKLQAISADVLLGNDGTGTTVEQITCTSAGRALLDDANAAAQRTTLGLGTLATQSGTFSGTSSGTNTGDQNVFSTISVSGQSNVVADSTTDTLTIAAGSGITITTDAATDTVTIAASGGGSVPDFLLINAGII